MDGITLSDIKIYCTDTVTKDRAEGQIHILTEQKGDPETDPHKHTQGIFYKSMKTIQ